MIATSTAHVPLSTRLGDVHLLSAVLPAVLSQYGVSWPAESSRSESLRTESPRRNHCGRNPRRAAKAGSDWDRDAIALECAGMCRAAVCLRRALTMRPLGLYSACVVRLPGVEFSSFQPGWRPNELGGIELQARHHVSGDECGVVVSDRNCRGAGSRFGRAVWDADVRLRRSEDPASGSPICGRSM